MLNEYDVEFAAEKSPAKRAAFRNLILELLEKGAPINAVGLQGHLRGGWPIAKDELAAFTAEMRSYGLAVLVTELDVMDQTLPAPEAERDMLINGRVREFLRRLPRAARFPPSPHGASRINIAGSAGPIRAGTAPPTGRCRWTGVSTKNP